VQVSNARLIHRALPLALPHTATAMWSQTIARKIEDERRWRDGSEAICYTVNASTYTVDAAIGDCADEHELDTAAR